ncbi:hypothetical protein [Rathayibacter toxicus]|nr:hypothetical protein [Rathayibacter toxicus]QOD10390.1 hypothetical protein BSG36_10925 [Rathayibacter toxicus]
MAETDRFNEDRVGLDHLSFSVAGIEELMVAATVLAELGFIRQPIKD